MFGMVRREITTVMKAGSSSFCRMYVSCFCQVLIVLACCSCDTATAPESNRKPNLVFILADEQRFDTSEPYGNNDIMTPHLNALGRAGIVFRNAYVSQPVCSPARATLLTGLYPHTHGVTNNNILLEERVHTLPELLNDTSYLSAYIGKWHLGRENDAWHGFDIRISTEGGYAGSRNNMADYDRWLLENGYKFKNSSTTFSRNFVSNLPYEHSKSKYIEMNALEFLEENQERPFVLYLSFLEPHSPNNGPFNDLHDPSLVVLDSTYKMETGRDMPLRYHMKRGYDYGDISTEELFARYWGLVHQVDLSVGAVMKKLSDLGLDKNTIVIFTSEHGKMMRKFGLTGKAVMYEESSRVPWMMQVPGVDPTVIDRRVSHIDMIPTILDLMQKPIPAHLEGKSLKPVIEGNADVQDPVFIEWNPFKDWQSEAKLCPEWASQDSCDLAVQTQIRTVVTQDGWKLNWSSSDKSQLFNLNDDPMEVDNLYYKSSHQQKVKELKDAITQWQETTGDNVSFLGI